MTATTAPMARHPAERPLRKFLFSNRAALGSLAVFALMLLVFFVANPRVFSSWGLYAAVLTTLPVALFMVGTALAAMVFIGAGGLESFGVEAVPFLPPLSLKLTELPWLLLVPAATALIAWATARISVLSVVKAIY